MASLVMCNGFEVSSLSLEIPRVGNWVADLMVDADDPIAGAVSIDINQELTLSGTVKAGGVFALENTIRVVGGKGGLSKDATPRFYENGVQARSVVNDLMGDAGETLSGSSASALLSTNLDKWTTIQHKIGKALQVLMAVLDPEAIYRVQPDGAIFLGVDTFAEFSGDADVLDLKEYSGRMMVGSLAPTLVPGVTLGGKKISYVEHRVNGDGSSTVAYYDR